MITPEKNLLVVDNDEDWLSLLERFFILEGYKVHTAQKCEEALVKAKELRPACIIVDLHLGRENGLDLCSAAKATAELKDIPVIILSGAEAPENSGGSSYDAYICKALGVVPLLTVVKKLTR